MTLDLKSCAIILGHEYTLNGSVDKRENKEMKNINSKIEDKVNVKGAQRRANLTETHCFCIFLKLHYAAFYGPINTETGLLIQGIAVCKS